MNQIRVFSQSQKQWLNPILIPAPARTAGQQRLFSLALSPDGSKLAITDAGALAIYVLDPGSPSSITTYPLVPQFDLTNTPAGVAVTNAGVVYFMTFDQNGDGAFDLYRLDSSTGKAVTIPGGPYNIALQGDAPNEFDLRLTISADGSRVYFCNDGEIGYVDTTTNTYQVANIGSLANFGGGFELALSPDQTRLAAAGLITDNNGNGISMQSLGWNAGYDADYVYGTAFSSDSSLLFQPGLNAIDAYDGFTGEFFPESHFPFNSLKTSARWCLTGKTTYWWRSQARTETASQSSIWTVSLDQILRLTLAPHCFNPTRQLFLRSQPVRLLHGQDVAPILPAITSAHCQTSVLTRPRRRTRQRYLVFNDLYAITRFCCIQLELRFASTIRSIQLSSLRIIAR